MAFEAIPNYIISTGTLNSRASNGFPLANGFTVCSIYTGREGTWENLSGLIPTPGSPSTLHYSSPICLISVPQTHHTQSHHRAFAHVHFLECLPPLFAELTLLLLILQILAVNSPGESNPSQHHVLWQSPHRGIHVYTFQCDDLVSACLLLPHTVSPLMVSP